MSVSPKTTTTRDAWRLAFPHTMAEASRAIAFLAETWNEVVLSKPKSFKPSERENKLTELFNEYLVLYALPKGKLLGFWVPEHPQAIVQGLETDEPKVAGRIRKDISYLWTGADSRLMLIFEFKKLKATTGSWSTYSGEQGMRRFVDGNYAIGLPNAVMVGMVIGDLEPCVQGLKRSLQSTARKGDLRMVTKGDEKVIFTPSILFPDVANFDTEHNRPTDKAPPHGTIMLSHLFLPLPREAGANECY